MARTSTTATAKKAATKKAATTTTAAPGGAPADETDTRRPSRGGPRKRTTILYHELAKQLREQIASGELPPGAVLPSEAQFATQYGVTRATARSAVAALAAEGLITIHQGRGAFVRRSAAEDRPAHTQRRDPGTDPADDPEWTDAEEPSRYRVDAGPALALALGVAEHTPVFVQDRLLDGPRGQRAQHRLHVAVPVAADVPALTDDPFRTPSELTRVLADHYGELTVTEYVRARLLTPDDAAVLRAPAHTPGLLARRVTATPDGRVLAVEDTRTNADDTQYAYTLT